MAVAVGAVGAIVKAQAKVMLTTVRCEVDGCGPVNVTAELVGLSMVDQPPAEITKATLFFADGSKVWDHLRISNADELVLTLEVRKREP